MGHDSARLLVEETAEGLKIKGIEGSPEAVVEMYERLDSAAETTSGDTSDQETTEDQASEPPHVDVIVEYLMNQPRCQHTIGQVIKDMAGRRIKSRKEDGSQNRLYRRWRNKITRARERIEEELDTEFEGHKEGRRTIWVLPEEQEQQSSPGRLGRRQ